MVEMIDLHLYIYIYFFLSHYLHYWMDILCPLYVGYTIARKGRLGVR